MESVQERFKEVGRNIMRRKTAKRDPPAESLTRVCSTFFQLLTAQVLGWGEMIMFGLGAILGAGIFVLTGVAAREKAGPSITLSFLLDGLVCILSALTYAECASRVPVCQHLGQTKISVNRLSLCVHLHYARRIPWVSDRMGFVLRGTSTVQAENVLTLSVRILGVYSCPRLERLRPSISDNINWSTDSDLVVLMESGIRHHYRSHCRLVSCRGHNLHDAWDEKLCCNE